MSKSILFDNGNGGLGLLGGRNLVSADAAEASVRLQGRVARRTLHR